MENSSSELMKHKASMITTAETIVSKVLKKPVSFTSMERLSERGGRSTLFRCFISSENEPAKSLIIKNVEGAPFSTENLKSREVRRFLNDWVGAEFLSSLELENPVSPLYYGGDFNQGFFILEDLGEHKSLVQPLLEGDAASAEAALLKYWTCLGTLHAATASKAGVYEAMFTEKSAGQPPYVPDTGELEAKMKSVQALLEHLGVPGSSGLDSEIQAVTGEISQPGLFHVYIHSDPCPDNVFDLGDRYRLIDFEFSHFGYALQDAIYPRITWPSCWCANRLPDDVVARVENSYRAELVKGCPAAQEDEVWETAIAHACGMAVLDTLSYGLKEAIKEDHEWGLATFRQRILTQLAAFIRTSAEFHSLPRLRGAAEQLLTLLQSRWKEISQLPLYPAFREAG